MSRANIKDLMVKEVGILPLSFLKKSPWYKGQFIIIKIPQRRICKTIVSKNITKPLPLSTTFFIIPIKQRKLTKEIVVIIVNSGEETPNSIISFSYLWETSSSITLAVITNAELDNPSIFKTMSTRAKRQELVLLYSQILCSFHQPRIVPPVSKNSTKLVPYLANVTYAKGINHGLET